MTSEIALRKFSYAFGAQYLAELAPRIADYLIEFGKRALVDGVVNELSPAEESFRTLQYDLRVIQNPFEFLQGPPSTYEIPAMDADFAPLNCWSDLRRGENPHGIEFGVGMCRALAPFRWIENGGIPAWIENMSEREALERLDAIASFCYLHFLRGDGDAITSRDLWGPHLLLPDGAIPSSGTAPYDFKRGGQP